MCDEVNYFQEIDEDHFQFMIDSIAVSGSDIDTLPLQHQSTHDMLQLKTGKLESETESFLDKGVLNEFEAVFQNMFEVERTSESISSIPSPKRKPEASISLTHYENCAVKTKHPVEKRLEQQQQHLLMETDPLREWSIAAPTTTTKTKKTIKPRVEHIQKYLERGIQISSSSVKHVDSYSCNVNLPGHGSAHPAQLSSHPVRGEVFDDEEFLIIFQKTDASSRNLSSFQNELSAPSTHVATAHDVESSIMESDRASLTPTEKMTKLRKKKRKHKRFLKLESLDDTDDHQNREKEMYHLGSPRKSENIASSSILDYEDSLALDADLIPPFSPFQTGDCDSSHPSVLKEQHSADLASFQNRVIGKVQGSYHSHGSNASSTCAKVLPEPHTIAYLTSNNESSRNLNALAPHPSLSRGSHTSSQSARVSSSSLPIQKVSSAVNTMINFNSSAPTPLTYHESWANFCSDESISKHRTESTAPLDNTSSFASIQCEYVPSHAASSISWASQSHGISLSQAADASTVAKVKDDNLVPACAHLSHNTTMLQATDAGTNHQVDGADHPTRMPLRSTSRWTNQAPLSANVEGTDSGVSNTESNQIFSDSMISSKLSFNHSKLLQKISRGEADNQLVETESLSIDPNARIGEQDRHFWLSMKRNQSTRCWKSKRFWILGVVLLLVAALCTFLSIKFISNAKSVEPVLCRVDGLSRQCSQHGRLTEFPSCARAHYDELKANFIKMLNSDFDEEDDSCEPSNLALIGLAASVSGDESMGMLSNRYLLGLFFFQMGGPTWLKLDLWMSGQSYCSWRGILCNQDLDVVEIQLDLNNLIGSLPTEIGLLSSVQRLSLSANSLDGTLPSEIGVVSSLGSLNLKSNLLDGSLPSEIGLLEDLRVFDLSNNKLQGTIFSSIGRMSSLVSLNLNDNLLTGGIPSEIASCQTLMFLSLNSNELSKGIPTEIGLLSLMQVLDLENNLFFGSTIPSELGQLSELIELKINNSYLNGTLPTEIGNLVALSSLDLGSCTLSGNLPSELGNLHDLENLNLSRNRLNGTLPQSMGDLARLERLDVSYNQVTGTLPTTLGRLSRLRTLLLLGNPDLVGMVPKELCALMQNGALNTLHGDFCLEDKDLLHCREENALCCQKGCS